MTIWKLWNEIKWDNLDFILGMVVGAGVTYAIIAGLRAILDLTDLLRKD